MDRTTKENMVASLGDLFNSAQVGFLVDYRGLSVEEVNELRGKLREASSQMRVLKNNLAKIAIKDTPFEPLSDEIVETRAFIYGEEPVGPAKAVIGFQQRNDKLGLIAGLLVKGSEGQKLDESAVKSLASLPTREQLLGQFLSLLQAPQGKLVRTLAEVPASFVRTLSALAESKGEA